MSDPIFRKQYLQYLNRIVEDSSALIDKSAAQQISDSLSFHEQLTQSLSGLNQIYSSLNISQIYEGLLQPLPSYIAQVSDLSSKIFEIVNPIKDWQDAYTKQIAELVRGVDVFQKILIADFSAIRLSFEKIIPSGIFSELIKYVQENEDAAEAFERAGWPIAPSMSKELITRVVELHKQGKTRYANAVILGYYHRENKRNLKSMVDGWRIHPLFMKRMQIIDAVLKAHCDGNYTVSIPTLLPQVEGVLNDFVISNGLKVKLGKIADVYAAVIGDPQDHDFSNWAIVQTLLSLLQSNLYAYTSFEDELAKPTKKRKINRHTILHGISTDYNKPSDSLKLFVTLDAIATLQNIRDNSVQVKNFDHSGHS